MAARYLYKYIDDKGIGVTLRNMYEAGRINNVDQFREEMREYVLSDSQEI